MNKEKLFNYEGSRLGMLRSILAPGGAMPWPDSSGA